MVFGGTRIKGASNISKALARQAASEVAGKITQSVSAEDALATLSTAAEKLLKGKRLAIYDRTSNNTPRFARQYLISHERATHTVAVVRSLFAKASEGIAQDGQRELQAELDAYLKTDDQAIRGGKLKELVDRLKTARQPAAAPQSHETQAEVAGNLAPALGLAQAKLKLQLPSISQAPESDPPEQAPEPQPHQPLLSEKGIEWQGLPRASENERPRSQALPKPGELADPAIAPPENQPGPVFGQIEKAAEFTEEALAPAQGMAVELEAELEEPLQFDASFEEPASHRQNAAGSGRLSGELLLQSFAEDQDRQNLMAGDDAYYQDDDFDRRASISNFRDKESVLIEDEEFDAEALDRRSSIGRPASENNSFIDDEDEQELPIGPLGLRPSEQISPQDILAARQAGQAAAKRAEAWSQFTNQLDEYTELVVEWQAEFGRLGEGDPGDLYSRPLEGLPQSLRAGILKLEALLDKYDGRPTELSELRTLQLAVDGSAQRLDEGLGALVAKRAALLETMESVREQFDLDEAARDVVAQDLAQTDLILGDLKLLLEPSDSLQAPPDPAMVLQRQNDYQARMLAYPDEALGKVKQAWAKLNLEGLASLQAELKARLDSGETDRTTLEAIAQIRKAMKAQRESMSPLQTELQSVRDDLALVREDIVRDFGSTGTASQRMQAAVASRLNDVAQLGRELQQHLTGIDQALNRKVTLPAKVNAPALAPSNVEVAALRRSLLNFTNGLNPQEDLQTYDQNLLNLLNTLGSGAALSRDQVEQLSTELAAQGPVAGKLKDLIRILILTVTNERDEAVSKVMAEHSKRASDAQRQTQEAVRKKWALDQIIRQRVQRINELRSQIRTLNQWQLAAEKYIDLKEALRQAQGDPEKVLDLQSKIQRLIDSYRGDETIAKLFEYDVNVIQVMLGNAHERVEELESDLRLQQEGGLVLNTDEMSPDSAEEAQWAAMPLNDLEAEMAAQDKAMTAAQTQEQLATREQKRATAILSQDAELKEAELQKGLDERLQDLATTLEQLKAS
jgi:hypothetical protein